MSNYLHLLDRIAYWRDAIDRALADHDLTRLATCRAMYDALLAYRSELSGRAA